MKFGRRDKGKLIPSFRYPSKFGSLGLALHLPFNFDMFLSDAALSQGPYKKC